MEKKKQPRRLSSLIILLFVGVMLALSLPVGAQTFVALPRSALYADIVTDANITAGTHYYPDRTGIQHNYSHLSAQIFSDDATVTIEAGIFADTKLVRAATAGDTVIYVENLSGFAVGQQIRVGNEKVVISEISDRNKTFYLVTGLGLNHNLGTWVLNAGNFSDITASAYDAVGYAYGVTQFINYDGLINFDNLLENRIRFVVSVTDTTNAIRIRTLQK